MSNRVIRFETPFLARVPQLAPETIHDLIRHRGLEACGDLIAAATPEQLTSVLDLDLWSPARPGLDERFDVARFGEWVEALIDAGETVATRIIAALDANLVIAGLSRHILVFDPGSFEPTAASDDERYDRRRRDSEREVCGYIVRARRGEAWDAIVTLLLALDGEHADVLHTLMQGCRRLSDSPPEVDGLDDLLQLPEQHLHEVAIEREHRRAEQGYVTPGEARAFLQMARQPALTRDSHATTPGARVIVSHDGERATYLERGHELAFLANTLMAGCAIQSRPFTAREASEAAAGICKLGLEHWPARWPGMDMHDATANDATVNDTALPSTFVVERDLVTAFQVGWSVLYEDVTLYVADRLIAMLADLRCADVEILADRSSTAQPSRLAAPANAGASEIQDGLDDLRRALVRHRGAGTPWRARGALEVLSLLDIPAWAAVVGVLDECPVLPAALTAILDGRTTAISATELAFFSSVDQIRQVCAFMDRLPSLLLG
jgi:hypothetical protein